MSGAGELTTILYRGPLASCNYGCTYCPFAKRIDSDAQLDTDRAALTRFVRRVEEIAESRRLRVLFTPWGEALTRRWYRDAIVRLSHRIDRVAVQTNLAAGSRWLADARSGHVGFWAAWHPSDTTLAGFVRRVDGVLAQGATISVGTVISAETAERALELHAAISDRAAVWLNPQAPLRRRFTGEQVERLTAIDPHFPHGLVRHRSRGRLCDAGQRSFTVDGRGRMRRCHFVDEVIGDFYANDWAQSLQTRPCPRPGCDCFVGFSQLRDLPIAEAMGDGLLERNPRLPSLGQTPWAIERDLLASVST